MKNDTDNCVVNTLDNNNVIKGLYIKFNFSQ